MLFTPGDRQVIGQDPTLDEVRFIDRTARREIGKLSLSGAPGVTVTPDGVTCSVTESGGAIIDPVRRVVVGHLTAGQAPDGVACTRAWSNPSP